MMAILSLYFKVVYWVIPVIFILILLVAKIHHSHFVKKKKQELGIERLEFPFLHFLKEVSFDEDKDGKELVFVNEYFVTLGMLFLFGGVYTLVTFSDKDPGRTGMIIGCILSLIVILFQFIILIFTLSVFDKKIRLKYILEYDALKFFADGKQNPNKMGETPITSFEDAKIMTEILSIIPKIKETEALLEKYKDYSYSEERQELKQMYEETLDKLMSYQSVVFRAIGEIPPEEAVEHGIKQLKAKTEELRGIMVGANTQHGTSEHFIVGDLKRLLSHKTISEEEKSEIQTTIEQIQEKTVEMEVRREADAEKLDVHSTLVSARKLFELDTEPKEGLQ
ncbi:hypothetical protein [Rossellomorea marisflavi]|uniref:hypothetical protein n=1 Tax=Rossellomorea marisflavi TaxID=189381 RepID=UPI003F9EBAC7